MHRICTKYAKNICTNMQIYAIYMQKYANICSTVCATEICKNMQKYAKYMHAICKNMQNMQSRFLYAEYAKTSAIQSVTILYTISNNTQQYQTIYNNIDKILSILFDIVVYCTILYLLKIRHNIVFKYCLILYTIPNNKSNKIYDNMKQYLWLVLFINIVRYYLILFDIV